MHCDCKNARALQDDSDFFSSQGSINSLDDEMVRKECLSALERSGIPLSQAPPGWSYNSTSAPAASAPQEGAQDSSTTDMLVRHSILLSQKALFRLLHNATQAILLGC